MSDNIPPAVGSMILTMSNAWIVDDGDTFMGVYAGSAGNDPSLGRLVIFRDNHETAEQTHEIIDIPGAGTLTITNAPTGKAAAAVAPTAVLEFRTSDGRLGKLDLETNSLDIDG